jgi:multidrug efflux pump subunit AcrA (membrane-fusion protein)
VGAYEVRLPLSLDDYAFLEDEKTGGKVTLHAGHAGQSMSWEATIKRIEGEVDRTSRSVYVVAEISENKATTDLIKPGLFVKAEVKGRTLDKVIRVPRRAFLDERRLLVVTPDNKITFREVEVLRGDSSDLFVHSGLKAGERVVVTALGSPVEGMNVEVLAEPNKAGGNAP